jgi:hypothetical protein
MQSWSCARANGPPRLHNTCSLLHTVHLPAILLCAGNANADAGADADVTFAAAAANADSYVEAMIGELGSKCLDGDCGVGSWCCSVLACMVCANRFVIVAAGLQRLALPWDNQVRGLPVAWCYRYGGSYISPLPTASVSPLRDTLQACLLCHASRVGSSVC